MCKSCENSPAMMMPRPSRKTQMLMPKFKLEEMVEEMKPRMREMEKEMEEEQGGMTSRLKEVAQKRSRK